MKHLYNRPVASQEEVWKRAAMKVRYCCPHCGHRFKDKPSNFGVIRPGCPKCGTTVDTTNVTRVLDRTRRFFKWATVPAWGPLWVLVVFLIWRVMIKRVGAFGLDYGLRFAKIRSISAREREMLIHRTAEAVAEKVLGSRPMGGSTNMKPRSQCQVSCMGCPAQKKCVRRVDGFMGTFLGMSIASPNMAELQLSGSPAVQLCPPSQLFEVKEAANTETVQDVQDESSAAMFLGRRVLIVTDEGEEVETTLDYFIPEGVDGNPDRPWVAGKHIISGEQILHLI